MASAVSLSVAMLSSSKIVVTLAPDPTLNAPVISTASAIVTFVESSELNVVP